MRDTIVEATVGDARERIGVAAALLPLALARGPLLIRLTIGLLPSRLCGRGRQRRRCAPRREVVHRDVRVTHLGQQQWHGASVDVGDVFHQELGLDGPEAHEERLELAPLARVQAHREARLTHDQALRDGRHVRS